MFPYISDVVTGMYAENIFSAGETALNAYMQSDDDDSVLLGKAVQAVWCTYVISCNRRLFIKGM